MMGAFYESSPSYGLATVESESSPWQTSQAPGMSLEGTLGQQANETWGMGAPQPGNPFGLEDALTIAGQQQAPPDPIASLGAFQAQMVQSRQEEPPPIGSITRKADGTTDLKGVSSQFLEDVMGQMTDLKTMKAAAMARVAQLRQQEASGSPILDALSQFAGGMAANDPTMPGWVRALGQTNLQMGNQGIAQKRQAEEAKAFAYGKEISDTALAAAKLEDDKYKMTLSLIQKANEDAAKNDKDTATNFFKIRGGAIGQIKDSGVYDTEGVAAEMRSLNIPEDQIAAQVASLDKFAAAHNAKQEELANAKDAKERRLRANELSDMERRFRESEDRQTRAQQFNANRFEMKNSLPTKDDVTAVKGMSEMLRQLDKAEAYLGQIPEKYRGGPIEGWFRGKNPWRDAKDQEAFQTGYSLTLQGLKASGLAPISEIEFKNQAQQMFDIKKTWAQNKRTIDNLRQMVLKGGADYMQMQPHRNWTVAVGVLPPQLQALLPDLERRRAEIYSAGAPGQQPTSVGLPAGWKIEEVK